jgi:hypothetical protein
MTRPEWGNLNGLWEYAITPRETGRPDHFEGHILVPFALESPLSGVGRRLDEMEALWYRRAFTAPNLAGSRRLLLHFGAADWRAEVFVNGRLAGAHEGGFEPFSFDITGLLQPGEQELLVRVWDPTDRGAQPVGKQMIKNHGIFYTPVSGLWQTVWLEPVPATRIERLKLIPDVPRQALRATVSVAGDVAPASGMRVTLTAVAGGQTVASAQGNPGEEIALTIATPRLWSPEAPFLYDLQVTLARADQVLDTVQSYFGMRQIEVKPDEHGMSRLWLNGRPQFQHGPLDQGWWPDGLYTAPTDEALRFDIEVTKQLGFNMTRKTIKVEPARWYYWCDKLGLLVWQDMPSGRNDTEEARANFRRELKAMLDTLHNSPAIVMWVPFNESWGQAPWGPGGTREVAEWIKQYDPSRLVNNASGWIDAGVGDVRDMHAYPGPSMFPIEPGRASVLGEFGAIALVVPGHLWDNKAGQDTQAPDGAVLVNEYRERMERLRLLQAGGLAAAVYTQLTDVETEINGLLTYDRQLKAPAAQFRSINDSVYEPPPAVRVLAPSAMDGAADWRYVTEQPEDEWMAAGYNDDAWKRGVGGFGLDVVPGGVVRTTWQSDEIWLRRVFYYDGQPLTGPRLWLYTSGQADLYLNGQPVGTYPGLWASYLLHPLGNAGALRPGLNTLALHAQAGAVGHYADAGLIAVSQSR